MKKMKRLIAIVLSIVLIIGIVPTPVDAKAKIALSETKLILKVGKSKNLKLKNAKGRIIWTSNDKTIASVSSSGKVTANKAGKTTIVAKVGKTTKKCKVTVKAVNTVLTDKFAAAGFKYYEMDKDYILNTHPAIQPGINTTLNVNIGNYTRTSLNKDYDVCKYTVTWRYNSGSEAGLFYGFLDRYHYSPDKESISFTNDKFDKDEVMKPYEFCVEYNGKSYDKCTCLIQVDTRPESQIQKATFTFNIPKGYDGIVAYVTQFGYFTSMEELNEYHQKTLTNPNVFVLKQLETLQTCSENQYYAVILK